MVFLALKTFDLDIQCQNQYLQLLSLDQKFKTIIKTFDLVPKFIKTFHLVPKKRFDLVPNLTETFDLVVRSSAIRSSDQTPFICLCQLFQTIHVVYLKYPFQKTIFLIKKSLKDVFIFYLNIFYVIFHLDKSFFLSILSKKYSQYLIGFM